MRSRTWLAWVVAGIACGAVTPVASAQCAGGRMVTDATAGRCCWPGQSWDDERARCQGPPSCPAGMAAEGDGCVPMSPSPPAVATAPQPAPASPPSDWPAARGSEPTETEPIVGLAVAGGVSFAITYLATVIGSSVLFASCYGGCELYALNYIPVVGPIVYIPLQSGSYSSGWTYAFFFPASIIQVVTFTLLMAGVGIQRPVRGARQAALPEITGGPGDFGAGLRWAF